MTASIITAPLCLLRSVKCGAANVDFRLGITHDFETSAAQQRLNTGAIGYPPVGRVPGVAFLDEIETWKIRPVEDTLFGKRVVFLQRFHGRAAALHRLKNQ